MTNQKTARPQITEEQVAKLRDHLKGHHLEALIRLALATGMRRGELLSLKWQDLDTDKCEVHFQDAKTRGSRVLPLPADVTEVLLQRLEAQLRAKSVWSDQDPVFLEACGLPLNPHQLMKDFTEVTDLAGLPRFSFHDLRRYVKQKAFAERERENG